MRIGARLLTNAVLIATFAVVTTVLLIGMMSYNYGKNLLEDRKSKETVNDSDD